MLRFALPNLMAGATVTCSAEDPNYPASNLAAPEHPFLPAKTTATGAQSWVVDFHGTTSVGVVGLIRSNFTSVRVQGNATDSWGAPSYDQLITLGRQPWVGTRYHHGHAAAGFAYRFLRLSVPSQSPVPEGVRELTQSFYLLGGLYVAAGWESIRNLTLGEQCTAVFPRADIAPGGGGWRARVLLGEPYFTISGQRDAITGDPTPAKADELASWLSLERRLWEAGTFLVQKDLNDPAQVGIARLVSEPTWTIGNSLGPGLSTGSLDLEEVVGGVDTL